MSDETKNEGARLAPLDVRLGAARAWLEWLRCSASERGEGFTYLPPLLVRGPSGVEQRVDTRTAWIRFGERFEDKHLNKMQPYCKRDRDGDIYRAELARAVLGLVVGESACYRGALMRALEQLVSQHSDPGAAPERPEAPGLPETPQPADRTATSVAAHVNVLRTMLDTAERLRDDALARRVARARILLALAQLKTCTGDGVMGRRRDLEWLLGALEYQCAGGLRELLANCCPSDVCGATPALVLLGYDLIEEIRRPPKAAKVPGVRPKPRHYGCDGIWRERESPPILDREGRCQRRRWGME